MVIPGIEPKNFWFKYDKNFSDLHNRKILKRNYGFEAYGGLLLIFEFLLQYDNYIEQRKLEQLLQSDGYPSPDKLIGLCVGLDLLESIEGYITSDFVEEYVSHQAGVSRMRSKVSKMRKCVLDKQLLNNSSSIDEQNDLPQRANAEQTDLPIPTIDEQNSQKRRAKKGKVKKSGKTGTSKSPHDPLASISSSRTSIQKHINSLALKEPQAKELRIMVAVAMKDDGWVADDIYDLINSYLKSLNQGGKQRETDY